jgi:hypothetical protein
MKRALLIIVMGASALIAQEAPSSLTLEQKEQFLLKADIKHTHDAKKGVTGTSRATLEEGGLMHDASIQCINEEKPKFETARGTELGFRDSYLFNIAAYQLGKLLGIEQMIPPSVDRTFRGRHGSYTWWIEDVQMDESERIRRHIEAPDKDLWARQYQIMKVFDQLICNVDRNQQNILYDKTWKLWMIDHSRAFRTSKTLLDPKSLERCDRVLLANMKTLDEQTLKSALGKYVRGAEIKGLLARRDLIVAFFDSHPDKLYDYLAQAVTPPNPVARSTERPQQQPQ